MLASALARNAEEAEWRARALEEEVLRRLEGYVVARGGETLEQAVGRGLSERGPALALAESRTGGRIGHRITGVPGSSEFFERGLVVYSNRAKQELLGVKAASLEAHGAVSAEVAAEMAQGARRRAGVDLGLAVTGIAGPGGGSPDKPVGTVYFGLADGRAVGAGLVRFQGDRAMIKAQAAEEALNWLRRYLEDDAFIHGA